MRSSDSLHRPAIPIPQASPVDRSRQACVARPVVRDRDFFIGTHDARHARRPQQLAVAKVSMYERVQVTEKLHSFPIGLVWRRDEFEQRLGVIGRQIRVCQSRGEFARVHGFRQLPVGAHAQALLLDASETPPDQIGIAGLSEPTDVRFQQTRFPS
jgi:hypothetical protein